MCSWLWALERATLSLYLEAELTVGGRGVPGDIEPVIVSCLQSTWVVDG